MKLLSTWVVLVFFISLFTNAQNSPSIKWTVKNAFEQKVFIENKGQYEIKDKVASNEILFGARQEGLQYYFTNNGIWIKRIVTVKRTDEEIEQLKAQLGGKDNGEKDEKELAYKMVDEFHQLNFIGANPEATITSDGGVSQLYNFTTSRNENVSAHAFKKITYRNLYPNIDMEFYFPEDKQGYEYSFIVHPGGDATQIKMQYPVNERTTSSAEGNIVIESSYGNFTDHAPVANQNSANAVSCSFRLNNSITEFNIGDYNKSEDLIIDPWTTTPTFTGINDAYDVDYDNTGNVYIYGGGYPWQIIKFNSSGTKLWSYTTSFVNQYYYYGDFAVDRNSQSVYIVQGFLALTGAQIIKLNAAGSSIKNFSGNSSFTEMWRIAFSRCTNQGVIAGGGITTPSDHGCLLDTNLTSLSPVNVLNTTEAFHDMWGLAVDNFGNCYMATAQASLNSTSFNNVMLKLPLPSLKPFSWSVNTNYKFSEVNSVDYAIGNYPNGPLSPNGYNGMAVSAWGLFTYDGYILKSWEVSSGKLLDSLSINGASQSVMHWGGLAANNCGDIFLGSIDSVKQYNSSFKLTNSLALSDTVFDVMLGNNKTLYACGKGFVSAMSIVPSTCIINVGINNKVINATNSITNTTCSSPKSGSITITSITGGTPPYNVIWNTTPKQTGLIAKNLTAGTYVATITDSSCGPNMTLDTVTVIKVGGAPVAVNSAYVCAKGGSATLIATGATKYTWTPSKGLSATTGSSVIASPTITTTYLVIGSKTGFCKDTAKSIVTVRPLLIVGVTPTAPSVCVDSSVQLVASGAVTYNWSPSLGLNKTTGDSVIATIASVTTYTVTGTDKNGCANTAMSKVGLYTPPVITVNPASASVCLGSSVQLQASGGSGKYIWVPSTGLNNTLGGKVSASPTVATTYIVTGYDHNGCPDTQSVVVTVDTAIPKVKVTPASPGYCTGGKIKLTASGASTYTWVPSTGLSATKGSVVTASPTVTTTYTVTGTNSSNCSSAVQVTVSVFPFPFLTISADSSNICPPGGGPGIQLIAKGAATYTWSPSTGLNKTTGDTVIANPTSTVSYKIIGVSNGCSGSTNFGVTVKCQPTNNVSATNITDTTVTLSWIRSHCSAIGYKLEYKKGISKVWTVILISTTDTFYNLTGLTKGTSYDWNIAAQCVGGSYSAYSFITSFSTLSNRIGNFSTSNPPGDQLLVYPNPTNNFTTVEFTIDEPSVQLSLVNILGQTIYSETVIPFEDNNYKTDLDLSKLPAGMYEIVIRTSDSILTKKISKID